MISALLKIAPDDGHEARLQAAFALVQNQGGYITFVQTITVSPAPFSHGRLREMLLGRVTRELLKKSPIPLLLVH